MIAIVCITAYLAVSVLIFAFMNHRCKTNPVLAMPKKAFWFYLLSVTWGLPMVAFGSVVALYLILCGHRPTKYGWCWCFSIPDIHWGLELGLFFIAPAGYYETIKMHEHGHAIQNIYFGVFTPAVSFIPSAVRFWCRAIKKKLGKPVTADYSDAWFEKSADASGLRFMNEYRKKFYEVVEAKPMNS